MTATHIELASAPPAAGGRRPRVFVLSFSPIASDARVLRQIEYLGEHCDVVVAGYGGRVAGVPAARWVELPAARSAGGRLAGLATLAAGRALPTLADRWFATLPGHREAVALARAERCDVYLANDWTALPAAAAGARAHGGRLVFDAHEYAPLEWEARRSWRLLHAPLVRRTLRRYAPACDGAVTVCPPIAERYAAEYGLRPIVVRNAPRPEPELPRRTPSAAGAPVRLVHHGAAIRERRLERMIDAVAQAGPNFTLDMMLVGDPGYMAELRRAADAAAPGRVRFVPPVPPERIVRRIAEYDLGFFLLDDDIYNYAMALPNKFFDYACAGLGVLIGPSPAMRELGERYGFALVAPDFSAEGCAATLRALGPADVARVQAGARLAARELNADVEMRKLVDLVAGLAAAAPGAR